MGIKRILAYAATYLLWGGAYLAVRVLIEVLPSFFAAGARYLLAALCLSPFILLPGAKVPSRRQLLNAVWTGLLLLVAGYGVVFWAERRLPSWMVAVLLSTAFLWTYLAESLVLRSYRFRAAMLLPLLVGLAGMPLVVGGASHQVGLSVVPALAVLLGAVCWSAGSVLVKWVDMPSSTIFTVELQLASSGLLLLCFSATLGEWAHGVTMVRIFAWRPLLAMAYLVFGCSLLGFASFHWLLKHEPASLVATSSYVNPLVAMIIGLAGAHEPFSRFQLAGAMAVLGSIVAIWHLQSSEEGLGIMSVEQSPESGANVADVVST
jgi:drug/metabolite transporter (DMT)-like permease